MVFLMPGATQVVPGFVFSENKFKKYQKIFANIKNLRIFDPTTQRKRIT